MQIKVKEISSSEIIFLLSYSQAVPQPDLFPSPPMDSQTEATETKKSTSEKEPTDAQDKGCSPEKKEQTSDQAKASSDSGNDERKHSYKMAFVKSS